MWEYHRLKRVVACQNNLPHLMVLKAQKKVVLVAVVGFVLALALA
jgi:hypothetical protein